MCVYNDVQMFVYSGTGNSLSAGRWMKQRAEDAGRRAGLTPIDVASTPRFAEEPQGRTLLGFLYATHGFCTPWMMLKFILFFERCQGRPIDVFLLNTRAGSKLGSLYLGGISGIALLLPTLILLLKGYRLAGMRPLDMPSNWIQLHPGVSAETAEAMAGRCHQKIMEFTDRLLAGKRAIHGLWTLPLDLALLPIAAVYLPLGRFGLAKLQLADHRCDGCGVCAKRCPTQAIEMRRGLPFWTLRCESCMRCYGICPKNAVQTSHNGVIVLWIVVHLGVPSFAILLAPIWGLAPVVGPLLYLASWYALNLAFFVASYQMIWWVQQLRPLRKAFSLTSPTYYFRRYIAPDVKLRDFRTGTREVTGPKKTKSQHPESRSA